MKKYFITLLSAGPLFFGANAQEQEYVPGAASFLNIIPDARTAAMGGAGSALRMNTYSYFHNSASILSGEDPAAGVAYSFTPWLAEVKSGYSLNSMGAMYRIDRHQGVVAGFRYFNYPKIDSPAGGRPDELAVDIGYARRIAGNFSLSLNARYINSDIGTTEGAEAANSVGFDLGAFYLHDIGSLEDANWTVGLKVANIGPKLKYQDNIKADQPALAKLGGSVYLPLSYNHRLMAAVDLGYQMAPSEYEAFSASAGVEYNFLHHFCVRGGYHYGDEDKWDESYGTAGLGVNLYGAHIDFAYLFAKSDSVLKNTFWISLGFAFYL